MRARRVVPAGWLLALSAIGVSAAPPDRPVIRVNQRDGTRVLTPRFITPAVAIDDDGGFAAVWADEDPQGAPLGVYARRFDGQGRPECGDITLEVAPRSGDSVTVAGAANGRFVVAWDAVNREDGVGRDAWYRVFDRRGNAASVVLRANALAHGQQGQSTVGMARDGRFVVAWRGDTSTSFSDEAVSVRIFGPEGEPETGDIRVTRASDRSPAYPRLAVGDDGALAVVFVTGFQGGGESVYLRRYDRSGNPEGEASRVNLSLSGPQREASVAVRRDRSVVVAWDGLNVGDPSARTWDSAVCVRLFSADGEPLSGEIRADAGDAMYAFSPTVASAGDGSFAVAWSSHADPFSSRVLLRRFRADGSPAGPARDVCEDSPGHHSLPSLAGNRRGDLVVVWSTIVRDGDSTHHLVNSRSFPAGS